MAARAGAVTDEHGTAVAATAAAPANGVGIVGLWPGLPTRVYAHDFSCGGAARAIDQASADGASVINMSFGSRYWCHTLYVAVTGSAGSSVMVASGGNEFDQGNVPLYPASWPHVMTVAESLAGTAIPKTSTISGKRKERCVRAKGSCGCSPILFPR